MCFTIEPMINVGTFKDKTWPDNWTSVTFDGKRSAQFGTCSGVIWLLLIKAGNLTLSLNIEHTLLVTETGVEVLTARLSTSPGGPVPMPTIKPAVAEDSGKTVDAEKGKAEA